ncbi:MarR family transcriptional regulator [Nocardioides marmoriginsengisoli]|uniref:MarR family transcriptional regulator n=1 Tax=Nocardioides marmoriginsengisoli TaxID=661483 RepID=A0A3N0CFP4_9ACTN|nr:transcriptional regulator [Nocardioides marmoriginsengisoli]RNL62051.1 MarR family transcriptional regulator [Nocardioides marmoriginsengisoli]
MGELDRHLQPPARLKLMTMLATTSEVEFVVLRDGLDVSDSVLSKHVAALSEVGYLRSRKGTRGGRRTTWVSLTGKGRKVLTEHVGALRAIIASVE